MNPGSVILSGVMMLDYMGWNEAGALVVRGLERAIATKRVTYDLARQMPGATEVSTSAFGEEIGAARHQSATCIPQSPNAPRPNDVPLPNS